MKQIDTVILSCSIFFLMVIYGCVNQAPYKISRENQALLDYFDGLYHLPQNSPARFALNEIAKRKTWRAFKLLSGSWPGSDEDRLQAVKTLTQLKRRIEKGLRWPFKSPPEYNIPYTKIAPEIDGNINDACWKTALTLKGSYPIDSVKKEHDGSIWKIMWDSQYLYVGVFFSDSHIVVAEKTGHPYLGDSLEIFLMSSCRLKNYWEIIIGVDGNLFEGLHYNNKWGGFIGHPEDAVRGLIHKCRKMSGGFTVEAAIPFNELPNYQLGNTPKSGEFLYFVLIRTNKNTINGPVKNRSAFPILYGGHNIFGYAAGRLCKSQ